MRVCAVIVTYNRVSDLEKCIIANLNQTYIPDILVVDNASTDETFDLLRKYEKNKYVKYIRLPQNLGGAGGFYYGMKTAFESGKYDCVWLMDDDGRPAKEDCLEALLKVVKDISAKQYILNSLVICDEKNMSWGLMEETKVRNILRKATRDNLIIGKINPFNGPLVSYETYKKIGLPRKEFFIKGDESEYSMRAEKKGVFIATCVTSKFYHPQFTLEKVSIGKKRVAKIDEPYWKMYYRARNGVELYKLYGTKENIFWHVFEVLYSALKSKEDRGRKLRYTIIGLVDGFRGNFKRIKF